MFLIEECVKQHHLMNELYDGAVNTVRLVTILHDGESKIISSFIRIGANGSVVDNMVAGGILAGVDEETGEVILVQLITPVKYTIFILTQEHRF